MQSLALAGHSTIEQADKWLPGYLAEHNQRFAVAPRQSVDAHRPWSGTAEALQRICAHHHQRQVSTSLSCQFEGQLLQVHPGQAQAPKGRARMDIAQYACGRLELLYKGNVLVHSAYTYNSHLGKSRVADEKTLNAVVDKVARDAQSKISTLRSQIAHQDAQRAMGIYVQARRANEPPREGTGRFGLRPSRPVPSRV